MDRRRVLRLGGRAVLSAGPLAAAGSLVAGCSRGSGRATPRTNPVDEVGYATGFKSFGRGGFVWVAQAKGFFAQAGIRVNVTIGDGQPYNIALTAQGRQYQFMETETTQHTALMLPDAGGKPGVAVGTKIVAAVHQRTVIALMSRASLGIRTPRDLAGRRVGYAAPAPRDLFPAYANILRISQDQRRWVKINQAGLFGALASGQVEAIGQFVTGLPAVRAVVAPARPEDPQRDDPHHEVTVFPYGDQLTDLYGNAIAVNQGLLDRRPDLVRRFVEPLLEGLRYAIEHPDEAGVIINRVRPETNAKVAQAELEAMGRFVTAGGVPPGALDATRMAHAIALLQTVGMVKGPVTPDQLCDFRFAPKAV